jgi:two-component system sensor histidine kinase CiaH
MTMEKSYRRFVEWVTKWKINERIDEFFEARVGLAFYYLVTAVIILGGSSIITYNAVLSNLTQYIMSRNFDPNVARIILDNARIILLNRFLTIDSLIILSTVLIGFFLTNKTLKPIKFHMQRQKRFIADASHELRTPIAVVISGMEVALNNKNLDFSSAKKTLEESLEEMRELSELCTNLLDISRYENFYRLNLKYEKIRIDEKLKNISEKTRDASAKLKGVKMEIKIEPDALVWGNRIELARVFYNIFDNAIKYTPSGGKISVLGEKKINKYQIIINNTGPIIPKEALEKIFDPFFRTEESRHTKGAGLGLTLARRIVEGHKGSISMRSKEQEGTHAIISLPLTS